MIFFGIALAMGVFVSVIAGLLKSGDGGFPAAATPSAGLMGIAVLVGIAVYRLGFRLGPLTSVAFLVTLGLVWLGYRYPTMDWHLKRGRARIPGSGFSWATVSLRPCSRSGCFCSHRDFVNSLLLYLGIGATYIGFFVLGPSFAAPAFDPDPIGAPPIFPFVFIVIACGAASGFHSLVASGTTAKQLDKETDARFIGYGGMVGESLLGLMAVLACTAGFSSERNGRITTRVGIPRQGSLRRSGRSSVVRRVSSRVWASITPSRRPSSPLSPFRLP